MHGAGTGAGRAWRPGAGAVSLRFSGAKLPARRLGWQTEDPMETRRAVQAWPGALRRHAPVSGPFAAVALALAAALSCLGIAGSAGLLLGSASGSVPPGLYLRSAPPDAAYVTFCLAARHRRSGFYPHFCAPDRPDGMRILKRIAARHPDGGLTVEGDTPRSLDSRLLGRIDLPQVRSWWRPLVQAPRLP